MSRMFRISFLNKLTGKRQFYMNIAFETEESAQRELSNIKRVCRKKEYSLEELLEIKSQYLRSWMVGTDWKIEEIKVRKI